MGCWIDNGDGSYTAEENDTLWGLEQKTGIDWHYIDYSGKPENLKVGQTVKYKTISEQNLIKTQKIADYSSVIFSSGGDLLKNMATGVYTKATAISVPLKCLDDPFLMANAETASEFSEFLGCFALDLAFGLDIYDGVKEGLASKSWSRGVYRTLTNITATGLGYIAGTALSTVFTPLGGAFLGVGANLLLRNLFGKLENWIWEEK